MRPSWKDCVNNIKLVSTTLVVLSAFVISATHAQNNCSNSQVEYTFPVIEYVFTFECNTGTIPNPTFPSEIIGIQNVFTTVDMSPNLYTILPVSQLCPFVGMISLDLSNNLILSMTGRFKSLSCLTSLKVLDLSSNLIMSPLVASDFEDTLPARLTSLNLNYNQIPSIDSDVFIKSDNTSRFPNLTYLGLVGNQIKVLDLLWPLSLPSLTLSVDLSFNPIASLQSSLSSRFNFRNDLFVAMSGNRSVNAAGNSLTSIADSQLMQYQIYSAAGFVILLGKLANVNLQTSLPSTYFTCFCPPATGLYTVYWYGQIRNSISSTNAPIFSLYCANTTTYIFNFACPFIGTTTTTSTTTTSTTTTTTTTTTRTTTTTITTTTTSVNTTTTTKTTPPTTTTAANVSINAAGLLIGGEDTSTNQTSTTLVASSSNNALIALILIPLGLLFLVLLFLCCCGRPFLVCFYDSCNANLCSCWRADKSSLVLSKKYDITFCFSHRDEEWVDEEFIPALSDFDWGYSINKVKLNQQLEPALNAAQLDGLRSSKRIVFIFSQQLIDQEWRNKSLQEALRDLATGDRSRIFVLVNRGDVSDEQMEACKRELAANFLADDEQEEKISVPKRLKLACKERVRYNCSLTHVEVLEWDGYQAAANTSFWQKFKYIMPMVRNATKPTEITESSPKYKRPSKRPAAAVSDSKESLKGDDSSASSSPRSDESADADDFQLITSLKNSIDEANRSTRASAPPQPHAPPSYPEASASSSKRKVNELVINDNFWDMFPARTADADVYDPISSTDDKNAYVNRFGVDGGGGDLVRHNSLLRQQQQAALYAQNNKLLDISTDNNNNNNSTLNVSVSSERSGETRRQRSIHDKSSNAAGGGSHNKRIQLPGILVNQLVKSDANGNFVQSQSASDIPNREDLLHMERPPSRMAALYQEEQQQQQQQLPKPELEGSQVRLDYEVARKFDASLSEEQAQSVKYPMPKKKIVVSAEVHQEDNESQDERAKRKEERRRRKKNRGQTNNSSSANETNEAAVASSSAGQGDEEYPETGKTEKTGARPKSGKRVHYDLSTYDDGQQEQEDQEQGQGQQYVE